MTTNIINQDPQKTIDYFYDEFVKIIEKNSSTEEIKNQRLAKLHKTFYSDVTETEFETTTIGIKTVWQLKMLKLNLNNCSTDTFPKVIVNLFSKCFEDYDLHKRRILYVRGIAQIKTQILNFADDESKKKEMELLYQFVNVLEEFQELSKYRTPINSHSIDGQVNTKFLRYEARASEFQNYLIQYIDSYKVTDSLIPFSAIGAIFENILKSFHGVTEYREDLIIKNFISLIADELSAAGKKLTSTDRPGFKKGLTAHQIDKMEIALRQYMSEFAISRFRNVEKNLFNRELIDEKHLWKGKFVQLNKLSAVLIDKGYFLKTRLGKEIKESHIRQFLSSYFQLDKTKLNKTNKEKKVDLENAKEEFYWVDRIR